MLFHEPIFIFGFLPVFLISICLILKYSSIKISLYFLSFSSIVFYGYWNIIYVPLLISSIAFNFYLGKLFECNITQKNKKLIFIFGLIVNISVLIFFKYLEMFANTLLYILNIDSTLNSVELPLGISFFTFLQIAFIVDKYKKNIQSYSFLKYFLFVSFFPHLIAGPLVHHSKLICQFDTLKRLKSDNLSIGFLIFTIGLFKKLVIVGTIAPWSDNLFNGASLGIIPSFVDSWIGVVSFSLQIYFDFSAYSDMAIGLSKMMGILLPINFNSPYKSDSFIDFWRRWHITLSSFLKEYLYFTLGGNRKGLNRQYINILIVMSIAGLWHGASWLFVVWGGLHGILLVLNHLIRHFNILKIHKFFSVPFMFILVTVLWVPFRSNDLSSMMLILEGLIGLNGITVPYHYQENFEFISYLEKISVIDLGSLNVYGGGKQLITLLFLMFIVLFFPNTQQVTAKFKPVLDKVELFNMFKINFSFNALAGIFCGIIFSYILILSIQGKSGEFIYFQF